jgi:hypothetical protein
MIYGSVAGFILLITGLIGGRRWDWGWLRRWGERWRRRRLITLLGNILKRLRRNLLRRNLPQSGLPGTGELLGRISGEFRTFLGLFTRTNCRTLTAGEFLDFSLGENSGGEGRISGAALRDLFLRWDMLRFSGRDVSGEELVAVLDEVLAFLAVLAETERQGGRPVSPGPGQGGPDAAGSAPPGPAVSGSDATGLFPGGAG